MTSLRKGRQEVQEPIYISLEALPVARDSLVSIAIAYGVDSPGIESRWGEEFTHLSSRP